VFDVFQIIYLYCHIQVQEFIYTKLPAKAFVVQLFVLSTNVVGVTPVAVQVAFSVHQGQIIL